MELTAMEIFPFPLPYLFSRIFLGVGRREISHLCKRRAQRARQRVSGLDWPRPSTGEESPLHGNETHKQDRNRIRNFYLLRDARIRSFPVTLKKKVETCVPF